MLFTVPYCSNSRFSLLSLETEVSEYSSHWSDFSVYIPGVEVDPGHKESLEGIAGGFQNCVGVPECNLLLQFVSNLAQFKYKCDKMNIWITVQTLHSSPSGNFDFPHLLRALLLSSLPALLPCFYHRHGRSVHLVDFESVQVEASHPPKIHSQA